MKKFLGATDKKLKHIKQFEIEIDFNHMHTNILQRTFSHDLMKKKTHSPEEYAEIDELM